MRISSLFEGRRPSFSFEFFPPKDDAGVENLFATVESLRVYQPAYVSITYGAGGSTRARTIELAKRIKRETGLEVLAHVTCVGSTEADLRATFRELHEGGIENVLALRGDPPRGSASFEPTAGGFTHATDLIALLARDFPFCIGGAAYPEKHPEAATFESDLEVARHKQAAGAEFLITQLFFDNAAYTAFVARARAAGITIPIVPGIMPITNYRQIERFVAMCGATIPTPLRVELDARRDEPEAVAELGVAYATLQCADLLAQGAPGIHFYTLNKSPSTRAVVSALLAARSVLPKTAVTTA
jgi:methylenetetrahydrofolate reductase (NADPH)